MSAEIIYQNIYPYKIDRNNVSKIWRLAFQLLIVRDTAHLSVRHALLRTNVIRNSVKYNCIFQYWRLWRNFYLQEEEKVENDSELWK
jgi:hypothetical protein